MGGLSPMKKGMSMIKQVSQNSTHTSFIGRPNRSPKPPKDPRYDP